MEYQTIRYEQEGVIGILTLNRPERLNAINLTMRDELRGFFIEKLTDNDTRVIVMTGVGRGFCSGMDMKDFVSSRMASKSVCCILKGKTIGKI